MRKVYIPTILSFTIFISCQTIFTGCQSNEDIYISDNSKHVIKPIIPTNCDYELDLPPKKKNKKVHYNNQRTYCVFGKWYQPRATYKGEKFYGVSSWYGPNFHGKLTANGEIYDMYKYTAANKILPLGTKVKVTNLNNNKSVVVRINDRGPFVKQRLIDLSYVAGKAIGIDKTGTAPVTMQVLYTPISSKKIIQKPKNKIKYTKNIQKNNIKIQMGAFSSIKGAKIIKEKYKIYKPYIEKKKSLYKVYIGNFSKKEKAVEFKNKFQLKGFLVRD